MSMREFHGKVKNIEDTPFGYTLSLIGGKWKMVILYLLAENQPVRFNELQRMVGTITFKMLSLQLKDLESSGIVTRTEYPQIPPKVEYSLSDKGASLIPILEAICEWGIDHQMDSDDEMVEKQAAQLSNNRSENGGNHHE